MNQRSSHSVTGLTVAVLVIVPVIYFATQILALAHQFGLTQ